MTPDDQTIAFANELDRLVDRFRDEFDLTYVQMVGCLFGKATLLVNEAARRHGEAGGSNHE